MAFGDCADHPIIELKDGCESRLDIGASYLFCQYDRDHGGLHAWAHPQDYVRIEWQDNARLEGTYLTPDCWPRLAGVTRA